MTLSKAASTSSKLNKLKSSALHKDYEKNNHNYIGTQNTQQKMY